MWHFWASFESLSPFLFFFLFSFRMVIPLFDEDTSLLVVAGMVRYRLMLLCCEFSQVEKQRYGLFIPFRWCIVAPQIYCRIHKCWQLYLKDCQHLLMQHTFHPMLIIMLVWQQMNSVSDLWCSVLHTGRHSSRLLWSFVFWAVPLSRWELLFCFLSDQIIVACLLVSHSLSFLFLLCFIPKVSHCITDISTRGVAMVPKLGLDVMSCEVMRVLQLTDSCIVPISYQVPRKVRIKIA